MPTSILRISLLSLGCFCVFCGTLFSKESQWIVQWDNDFLTGSDRDYTNGGRLAYLKELDADQESFNWLQKLMLRFSGVDSDGFFRDRRFDSQNDIRFLWGMGVTQLMFTPDDPEALIAPDGERPYAGWLGLEISFHASSADSASGLTLSVGTTGENSYAEDVQEWVHENISDTPVYQGWDSQVPNEVTVNLHLDRKQRIHFFDTTSDWLIEVDGYYEWGAAVGNFRTDAYVGSLFRVGYKLPATYTTPRVRLGSYGYDLFRKEGDERDAFSLISFAGVRGYGVLHDITLDGPVFRDFDTGTESEPWVGEFIYGVGFQVKSLELSVSHSYRTEEFRWSVG